MLGTFFSVATTLFGLKQQSDASKEANLAGQSRQKATEIKNFQQKVGFINQFMSAEADFLSAGVQSGAGLGSSGVQGTMASARSQAAARIGEFDELGKLGAEYSQHMAASSRASTLGAAGLTLGGMFATHSEAIDDWAGGIFKKEEESPN